MECSRRTFVQGLGMSVIVTACTGGRISTWGPDTTTATSTTAPYAGSLARPNGRTLVVLELGGGNDGLNMVVPHADPAYRTLRPTLGIDDPLDLDGSIGLHPGLRTTAERYRSGQVTIVEGIGYPDPDLSHFESMDTWWTADGGTNGVGWLGRYLDGTFGFDSPTAAVSIGPGPSRAMLGAASYTVAIQGADGLQPETPAWIDDVDELIGAWSGFVPVLEGDPGPIRDVRRALTATVAARSELDALLGSPQRSTRRILPSFTQQLDVAATLATSDNPPQVMFLHGAGDFDTHRGQQGRHGALMSEIDSAIDSFLTRVEAAGRLDDTLLMTTSEFGRRAKENGDGTDHGTAAPHLLISGAIRGGRLGEAPDLTDLDANGNLRHTVDFRSLYASVLDTWLEADADEILQGTFERLPIL